MKLQTVSPASTTGPYFPVEFSDGSEDLTHRDGKTAQGQHILLSGRVLEKGGVPTRNMVVEIWQTDANGIYRHPLDPRAADADPGFWGWGRARTDKDGWYHLRTVVPGSYAEQGVTRCPHINATVLGIGLTRRLVTTIFVPNRHALSLMDTDPVYCAVADVERRRRLIAYPDGLGAKGVPSYRFDFILHGPDETPFFLD